MAPRQDKSRDADLAQALSLHRSGNAAAAAPLYRRVITREPRNAQALHFLGLAEASLGRHAEATDLMRRSVDAAPGNVDFLANYAKLLVMLGQHAEALAACEQGLAHQPANPVLLYGRALCGLRLGRPQEALNDFDRVVELQPDNAAAFLDRGATLATLGRPDDALASFNRALQINPRSPEAHYNIGRLLDTMRRHEEAIVAFERAIALRPAYPDAYVARGSALRELRRYGEALASYDKALALQPDLKFIEGTRLHCKMHICDWASLEQEIVRLHQHVSAGMKASAPFTVLATSASPREQLVCARTYVADRHPPAAAPLWRGEIYRHDKIRIAYMSGELREQATSYLAAGMFECHDRSRFEVHAIATGIDDGSPMRQRLQAAFDAFTDVQGKTDREIAEHLRRAEIDILVNLNGFFGVERTGIFALRPCPVQVNYLGYPGTMGAAYMDYIIADETVIPPDELGEYDEKVVYLPNSYQVNDRKRAIADRAFARADMGLPADAFVFCCFNVTHKILPSMFEVWMRLLAAVEGSVLWLLEANRSVKENLAREAERRGVAADRIVFAPFIAMPEHLARLRLADLVLDTLPHNAHTTASDALWAGVPVLTCLGTTFAGRVAASLLRAVGLPELVTTSPGEYEALALRLARDPAALAAVGAKLAGNRGPCPLFDTVRYTRDIEAAYVGMWERFQRGEPPESFAVVSSREP
jgi:predicted O-linked N-acetylglucosamine transferase (SPINDLY family)